jgi:hypothetical protein
MRTRHPFPDLPLDFDAVVSMGDGSEDEPTPELVMAASRPAAHPDAVEKGIDLPLGFVPHRGENRRQRREAVANWQPPEQDQPSSGAVGAGEGEPGTRPGDEPSPATPARMPTRRELWAQRQRQRRGTLDPELRRLQRRKAQTK